MIMDLFRLSAVFRFPQIKTDFVYGGTIRESCAVWLDGYQIYWGHF